MAEHAKPFVPAKELKLGTDSPSPPVVKRLSPNTALVAHLLTVAFTHVSAHITSLSNPENDAREFCFRVSVTSRAEFREILNLKHEFKLRILKAGDACVDNGKKYDLYGYFCVYK